MSEEKDPKKDESEEAAEDYGCDCSHCPGCGVPEKPEEEEE